MRKNSNKFKFVYTLVFGFFVVAHSVFAVELKPTVSNENSVSRNVVNETSENIEVQKVVYPGASNEITSTVEAKKSWWGKTSSWVKGKLSFAKEKTVQVYGKTSGFVSNTFSSVKNWIVKTGNTKITNTYVLKFMNFSEKFSNTWLNPLGKIFKTNADKFSFALINRNLGEAFKQFGIIFGKTAGVVTSAVSAGMLIGYASLATAGMYVTQALSGILLTVRNQLNSLAQYVWNLFSLNAPRIAQSVEAWTARFFNSADALELLRLAKAESSDVPKQVKEGDYAKLAKSVVKVGGIAVLTFGLIYVGVARSTPSPVNVAQETPEVKSSSIYSGLIKQEDINHILDGVKVYDAKGNWTGKWAGGHRYGEATKGKVFGPTHTEFPSSWSDEKILNSVIDIASNPNLSSVQSRKNGLIEGEIDGVKIRVVFEPDINGNIKRIITSYPIK